MLGRQQIAGIPTALSELFKNAFDAYATEVRVDHLRELDLVLLRDDGVGMTAEDFQQRWLTVGTSSKTRGSKSRPPVPVGAELRATYGEKGIGRLAIASLGPQVLVLTRARPDVVRDGRMPRPSDKTPDLVVALMPWVLFEYPGVSLEDIDIPVRILAEPGIPSNDVVNSLADDVEVNLEVLADLLPSEAVDRTLLHLSRIRALDLQDLADLEGPSLLGLNYGTHFVVTPTDELLAEALHGREGGRTSELEQTLLGFTNTMTPGAHRTVMRTSFVDHPYDDEPKDLINEQQFWTPEDFERVDHEIVGRFDEMGQFRGTVSVYGADPVEHILSWPGSRGQAARCGPFDLALGYVQGNHRDSRLAPDDYALASAKLGQLSGLYVYRDGLRVLPYGLPEVDWLNVEERRSRNAGYYFFSYRRMFGAVDLTADENSALQEKAGREGFRNNMAYRDLRDILINFLQQIVADFFREGGIRADEFIETRRELSRNEEIRAQRAKKTRGRREKFRRDIGAILLAFDEGKAAAEVTTLLAESADAFSAVGTERDAASQVETLVRYKDSFDAALSRVAAQYQVSRPQGIGLSRDQLRDFASYTRERAQFELGPLSRGYAQLNAQLTDSARRLGVERELGIRLGAGISMEIQQAKSRFNAQARSLRGDLNDAVSRVAIATETANRELLEVLDDVEADLSSTDLTSLSDVEVVSWRRSLESRIEDAESTLSRRLIQIRDAIVAVGNRADQPDQILEALEEENIALREQADLDLELAQLGMAVQIVNHEFSASVATVRRNLRLLGPWSEANVELRGIQRELAASFDHLDAYLSLLTPLQRRLYRKPVDINGQEIYEFLLGLFDERLTRHDVELVPDEGFLTHRFTGFPSTFYPVFVNLLDNAIFWLQDQPVPRQVYLETKGDDLIVRDSGPGIHPRDLEAIFEQGFSRKPGGRGLGLRISRDLLARIDWHLSAEVPTSGTGAQFRLHPRAPVDEDT
jgi:signal transduction histidine kinase